MRALPDNLRDFLKKPVGQLVDEKELLELLQNETYIVSIGDMVTYTLLKNEIEPIFCIVDYKTRRGECSSEMIELIKSFGNKSVIVENPPATISDDLWNVIERAYENLEIGSLRIEIEGEEDLASLAAIYMAPSDVTIIYGLPDKGVLVIKPTPENKRLVKEILDKM
ncbi:DUF359 domain-containing protein [Candidatus Woesebacteria bacterium]|nr:MAG: DUF359 domain-containing protein [Candidatus Woesebacteria bacterium]